ncbi:WD40/YVTN/BNR-like repeat-containing protein [Paludibaculum fermentans]|uniref:Photosynthesis system II assembly factor Ycf48/Hcf136-like domain-containing protein n=1 Tax=Paludibaculum fermentans TaxID=1473598 RepID=A0A7S7NXB6_PALFE|nr:hypothetical protein [Paludibaculum fermentans]QOY91466.1 hypothetical protein IRI77_16405 [Paludibaculum fermentans]
MWLRTFATLVVVVFPWPERAQRASPLTELTFESDLPDLSAWHKIQLADGGEPWLLSRSGLWRKAGNDASWLPVRVEVNGSPCRRIWDAQWFDQSGIVLCENSLLFTRDLGRSWNELPPVPAGHGHGEINGLEFKRHGRVGWVYGGVYRPAKSDEDAPNNAISVDAQGVRSILEPAIFFTDDLGMHWVRQRLPALEDTYRITGLSFVDEAHGVALMESGTLFTTDGGRQWQRSSVDGPACGSRSQRSEATFRLVYLVSESHGFLSADDGSVFRTTDGARTWCQVAPSHTIRSQSSPEPSYFLSFGFLTRYTGWGVDMSGGLLETRDGGRSWTLLSGKGAANFEQVLLLNETEGWVLTDRTLLRFRTTP